MAAHAQTMPESFVEKMSCPLNFVRGCVLAGIYTLISSMNIPICSLRQNPLAHCLPARSWRNTTLRFLSDLPSSNVLYCLLAFCGMPRCLSDLLSSNVFVLPSCLLWNDRRHGPPSYGDDVFCFGLVTAMVTAVAQAVKSRQDRKFLRQLLRDTSTGEEKAEETANYHPHQDNENVVDRKPPGGVASKPLSCSNGELASPPSARAAIVAPSAPSEIAGNLDAARGSPVQDRNHSAAGAGLCRETETAGKTVCEDVPAAAGAGVVVGKAADSDAEVPQRQNGPEISTRMEELRQELRKAEHKDPPYGKYCL